MIFRYARRCSYILYVYFMVPQFCVVALRGAAQAGCKEASVSGLAAMKMSKKSVIFSPKRFIRYIMRLTDSHTQDSRMHCSA